jgi:ribonuclease-3
MAATESSGGHAIGGGLTKHLSPGQVPVALLDRRPARPLPAVVVAYRPAAAELPRTARGVQLSDWKALEALLKLKFKNPSLLKQALVHTSYLNENPGIDVGSNERLEFLGDAALGVVVARELYDEYPDVDEGKLTELRAHLVRRDTLADAAARFGLGEFLQLGRGEEAAGGRGRPTNLARAYEALVGAIFLDGGIPRVRAFVKRTLGDELAGLRETGMPHDPKSRLQEVVQSRWQTTPSYKLLKTEGPDHARRFTVQVLVAGRSLGIGVGRSKQTAEKEAAQQALDGIDGAGRGEEDPLVVS